MANSAVQTTSVPLSTDIADYVGGLFDQIRLMTAQNNYINQMSAQKQMEFQRQSQNDSMMFNHLEAKLNRDWQEQMSNTAHQREVADLQAAGLNPVLSVSGGNGSAVTSGATASGVSPLSGSSYRADETGVAAMASLFNNALSVIGSIAMGNTNALNNMTLQSMSNQTSLAMSRLSHDATVEAATRSASASIFGSRTSAQASMYNANVQAEWQSRRSELEYQEHKRTLLNNKYIAELNNQSAYDRQMIDTMARLNISEATIDAEMRRFQKEFGLSVEKFDHQQKLDLYNAILNGVATALNVAGSFVGSY